MFKEPTVQVDIFFKLQRQQRSYVLKYVLPLGFLVFLSTLSYFIDPKYAHQDQRSSPPPPPLPSSCLN